MTSATMSIPDALAVLHRALDTVYQAGVLLSGEIQLVVPQTPGKLETDLQAYAPSNHPSIGWMELHLRGLDAGQVPAPTPDPLPTLAAEAVPPGVSSADPLVEAEGAKLLLQAGRLALTPGAARSLGYTGSTCTCCGSPRMRMNGTCERCEECGATSGCG